MNDAPALTDQRLNNSANRRRRRHENRVSDTVYRRKRQRNNTSSVFASANKVTFSPVCVSVCQRNYTLHCEILWTGWTSSSERPMVGWLGLAALSAQTPLDVERP